jgi:thiamine biosynthesis lipoprotein
LDRRADRLRDCHAPTLVAWPIVIGRTLAVAFALMALACGAGVDDGDEASAVALTGAEACAADGMFLRDYEGPKAQILWRDGERTFYCEAREAFAEWLDGIRRNRIVAFYVQDLADQPWGHYPDRWIPAEEAVFVIASDQRGAMGSSFVSFLDRAHADAFVAKHGGRQLRLEEITSDVYAESQRAQLDQLKGGRPAAGSVVSFSGLAMGSSIEISAWAPSGREDAVEGRLAEALLVIEQVERAVSSWDPESETSAVNRAAGATPIAVGDDLRALVDLGITWSERTAGAFDVTVHPIVEFWRNAERAGLTPDKEDLEQVVKSVGFKDILSAGGAILLTKRGMRLDFGAIGKGYAVDRAADWLTEAGVGDFIVSAGGDLLVRGSRGGSPWQIGIRDPRGGGLLAVTPIENRAVATSGDYEQPIAIEGRRYSHIFDPRTGWPAAGLTSVTVISKRAADSDALATALFVMGSDDGIRFAEGIEDVEALFIHEDGTTRVTSGLRLEDERLEILE